MSKIYTIVSAVYNVEPYLNKYFKSIINQSLDFQKYINIILVDDGSTDKSSSIIKKWQSKYPQNILYIKQENSGQASARNRGLQHVSTQWVTFVDTDDFLDKHYFKEIHKTIENNKNINLSMISTSIHFYFDKYGICLNQHPLKYRFKTNKIIKDTKNLEQNIQLSVTNTFFRNDLILSSNLKFNVKVQPNFEDAHFVNKYLIYHNSSAFAFLKSAKYYYRKRSVGKSTLDGVWGKNALYHDVLYYGCLDLFKISHTHLGYIPIYLQRTILYHLSWYYKYLIDNSDKISFLTQEQLNLFEVNIIKLFSYIEIETINSFELVVSDFIKIAWLYRYKNIIPTKKDIQAYKNGNIYYFTFFSLSNDISEIKIDDFPINMPTIQEKNHTFLDKAFIYSYKMHIPIKRKHKKISMTFHNGFEYNEKLNHINTKIFIELKLKLKNQARIFLLK